MKVEDGSGNLAVPGIKKILRPNGVQQFAGLWMPGQNRVQDGTLHQVIMRKCYFFQGKASNSSRADEFGAFGFAWFLNFALAVQNAGGYL